MLKKTLSLFRLFGLDFAEMYKSIRGLRHFYCTYVTLKRQKEGSADQFVFGKFYPCLNDQISLSNIVEGHYFQQDLLVAARIYQTKPEHHIDVGSRIDGFVAHVASYRELSVIDIRKMSIDVKNITFIQADMMGDMQESLLNCTDSVSCLHALEHFGLGRYGDPVCYDGHLKGLENIYKMIRTGGKLYLSTPIGAQRIEFNAHRVFSISYLLNILADKFILDKFSYIDDSGKLHQDVKLNKENQQSSFNCIYGCGIFELSKI